jgi:hypothetical protein
MITLTIIQIAIFITYITFVVLKFGVLPSISESWYELKNLGGVWHSLFTWFCFGIGFTMFFQTNDIAPWLFFLSGAGFSMVGTATMFKLKEDIQPYIHFIGALCGIMGSLLGIWVERGTSFPFIFFMAFSLLITLTIEKNRTWWIEMYAFLCVSLGLLFA